MRKKYLGNCSNIDFGDSEKIFKIVDNAEKITLKEFIKNVNVNNEELNQDIIENFILYDLDYEFYYNNIYDIYFFIHSRIEYFFGD